MDWLSIVQLAIQFAPAVKGIIDEATSNDDIVTKTAALAPELGAAVTNIGQTLFPNASPALQAIGGIVAAFDPNITKWLQGSLNTLLPAEGLPAPNLTVDGIYGPKTIAAVEALQTKLGLSVDGIAGQITQAAISAALTKL